MRGAGIPAAWVLLVLLVHDSTQNEDRYPGCDHNNIISTSDKEQYIIAQTGPWGWNEHNSYCQEKGLEIPKPSDASAIELRHEMMIRCRVTVWLGARGDGSAMVWQRDGSELPSSHPLWYPGEPSAGKAPGHTHFDGDTPFDTDYCLELLSHQAFTDHRGRPYRAYPCDVPVRIGLCQIRSRRWMGPHDHIWGDNQCSNVGNNLGTRSLSECKSKCEGNIACNAINFKDGDCVLRSCSMSAPAPTWTQPHYKGYSLFTPVTPYVEPTPSVGDVVEGVWNGFTDWIG